MLCRPFSQSDFDALAALDLATLRREDPNFDALPEREREGRTRTSLAALRFYERSEHSFVAVPSLGEVGVGEETLLGALFAQSVWQGDRPSVLVTRVWLAAGAPPETGTALLRACTKSAYDAAIYEVHLPVTPELRAAAAAEGFREVARLAVRHLGSRAEGAPGKALSPGP